MKIKVTVAGETHEVEQSDLELGNLQLVDPNNPPKGLFNQDGVDEVVKARVKGLTKKDDLLTDKEFHKTVLSQYDITLDDNGKPKGLDKGNDEEKFAAWHDKHAKPLETTIDELKTTLNSTHKSLIGSKVEALVSKGLDPKVANVPFIKQGIENSLGYKDGKVVPIGADGEPLLEGNGKVMEVDSWFETEIKTGSLKDFAIDNRPGSSGFQNGGGNGAVVISSEDAKDNSKYSAAEKQASERGVQLEIKD